MNLNTHPNISVVLPVHETLQYLPLALSSLKKQTARLEVVIVFDGDKVDINEQGIRDYFNLDIKFIYHSENKGTLHARITARHSTGDYIFFLDPDDELSSCLGTLYKTATEEDYDIVRIYVVDGRRPIEKTIISNKKDIFDYYIKLRRNREANLINNLFKRDIVMKGIDSIYDNFKNIDSLNLSYHEDMLMLFNIIPFANKMIDWSKLGAYFYKRRVGSATIPSNKNVHDTLKIHSKLSQEMIEQTIQLYKSL